MISQSLETFVTRVRSAWGPLSSDLVVECREAMEALARTPSAEPWMAEILADLPAYRELYLDARSSFGLYAYAESAGTYRGPHDHGRGWVVYAVYAGEVEMQTYAKVADDEGKTRLVRRERSVIQPGQCRVFLPGDIHDTRCLAETTLKLRLTSCDFSEEKRAGRMTEYVQRDGEWTTS